MHISKGHVTNIEPVKKFFEELADGSYNVTFKPRKLRTLGQNAYYHAIMVPMVKQGLRDAGYDEIKSNADAHEVLKSLFLKKDIVSKQSGDIVTTVPGSTTDLTTVEFKEFMERVAQWSAEFLGVYIPPPGMQMTIHT